MSGATKDNATAVERLEASGTKELWEIIVPCMMRGKPVRTRHHRVRDEYVYRFSGGVTILRPAVGKWVTPREDLCEERVVPVRIACTRKDIERIADFTLKHYDQEAVMYYRISSDVVIRHRDAAA